MPQPTPDDLRTRIAEILYVHNCRTFQETGYCDCGTDFDTINDWADHVADVLIALRGNQTPLRGKQP